MKKHTTNTRGEFHSLSEGSFDNQCELVTRLFSESQDIIQAGRNTLKKITLYGVECVVKSFCVPKFPQNFSYGTFADSKAKKSYNNAKRLLSHGFQTPNPIGYFEHRSCAKLMQSYYICELDTRSQTFHNLSQKTPILNSILIKEFASYCHNLHQKGILHRAFNLKNILVTSDPDTTPSATFSLVDINRITWSSKPLTLKQSLTSLSRLPFNKKLNAQFIEQYALITNTNLEQCISLHQAATEKTKRYFHNKKRLRKVFPKR